MSDILLNMHLAESYASVLPKDSISNVLRNEDSLLLYNQQILKQYHVTKIEFDNSLQFYKKNPALLDSIYMNILNEISILQTKVKK